MNFLKFVVSALAISPFAVFAAQNAPYAVEMTTKGGGTLMSLDFESSGEVAAFTFRVVLPEGAKRIDTSRCLSELPAGFTGVCKAYGNVVAVTGYSADGKALPAGMITVGKLSYVSVAKAGAKIDAFEASNAQGLDASVGTAKVERAE